MPRYACMWQGGYTLASRNSYCEGIVSGIQKFVNNCKAEEAKRRAEKLARARDMAAQQKRNRRSRGTGDVSDGDSDDGGKDSRCAGDVSDGDDEGGDGNNNGAVPLLSSSKKNKRKRSNEEQDEEDDDDDDDDESTLNHLENEEKVSNALILHTEDVAAKILKSKNIKVKKAKRAERVEVIREAWSRGVDDSKNINLNERAIKAT
jgi:hypothetical protein